MRIAAHGLALDAPPGWDARIRRYEGATGAPSAAGGEADGAGLRAHPVLHAADFALPEVRGDYGSGAVETMGPTQAFVALLEFHPDSARTPLFAANRSMPGALSPGDFSPRRLQRTIRGQGGSQTFFVEGGRPFCLYVVLGSMANRHTVVARVNATLSAVEIAPRPGNEWMEAL